MNSTLKGTLITLLGVLIITPDTLLIRLIDEDSASINFWRGLFTFITVIIYLLITERINIWKSAKELNLYDYLGIIFFSASSLLFVYATNNNPVATTLVLLGTAPFFASILSFFFLKERISLTMLIGIFCCFIGVFIIISEALFVPSEQVFSWLAFVSALFCALAIAANFTLSRSKKQTNLLFSFALSGIVVCLCGLPMAQNISLTPEVYHWMLIDGLIVFPISFIFMLIGARHIPSPHSTMMLQLETFLGPLWVWLVLREFPGTLTFIGGGIIITSIFFVNFLQIKKKPN